MSSLYFSPSNVVEYDGHFWLSGIATGQPLWLAIEYYSAFKAQSMQLTAHSDYLGQAPQIQGMDASGQWNVLLELDVNDLKARADDTGMTSVTLALDTQQAYRQYRYYSEPSMFI